jgi:hypothetical protein
MEENEVVASRTARKRAHVYLILKKKKKSKQTEGQMIQLLTRPIE